MRQLSKQLLSSLSILAVVLICSCNWYYEWWYYDCELTIHVTFINSLDHEVLIRDHNLSSGVLPFFIQPNDTEQLSRSFTYMYHTMYGIGEDEIKEMSFKFEASVAGETGNFNKYWASKTVTPRFDTLLSNADPDYIGVYNDTFFIRKYK